MLPFLAQVAVSSLAGLWMTEAFRAKPAKENDVSGLQSPHLQLAHLRRVIAGTHTGHYTPPDVVELEDQLHAIAQELRAARVSGFPGMSPGVTQGETTMYGSIGADLMFGADDSDVLEALAVSGDGSSEIIGSDYDIVGAELIGAAKAGNPRAKAALRQIAMRNAGAVVKNDLKNRRRYPLGFVPTEVDSGDAATIPAAPQNLFRPERLVIPSDICFDFGVQDIKVGNQSQFAQSVEVPAAVFSEVSIDTNVTFDTAEVGNQISILVRNKGTTDDLEFTAAAIGTIAKA
jgi:hypothetical protein